MQKKLDEIQRDVDELIRLCVEAGGEFEPEPLDKFSKIGYLLLRMQDGELEEQQCRIMEEWLSSDQEALKYYAEFQQLNAMLYEYFHPERAEKLVERIKDEMAARNGC